MKWKGFYSLRADKCGEKRRRKKKSSHTSKGKGVLMIELNFSWNTSSSAI